MSGKRTAESQVTRENLWEHENGSDEEQPHQVKASAEVLAKRKILKPRSRLTGRTTTASMEPKSASTFGFNFQPVGSVNTSTTGSDEVKPNPFAGFGAPVKKQEEEKEKPNPFAAFGSSSASSTTENKAAFVFGTAAPTSLVSTKPSETPLTTKLSSDKPNKIKALNDTFYSKITQQRDLDPVANYTPILRKYIEYYEQIETDSIMEDVTPEPTKQIEQNKEPEQQKALPAPTFHFGATTKPASSFGSVEESGSASSTTSSFPSFNFGSKPVTTTTEDKKEEEKATPATKPRANDVIEVDDDSSEDEEFVAKGPTFTLAKPPTTTDSVFNLSNSTTSKNDSTITGPQFTLAKPPTTTDSVFKLTASATKSGSESSTPKFTFSSSSQNAENPSAEETKKNGSKPSGFTWNPSKPITLAEEKKEGDNKAIKPPSTGFAFSGPTMSSTESTTTTETPKAFSFNFSKAPVSNGTSGEVKPTFSFGSQSSDKPKPAFTFGTSSTSDSSATVPKPEFNFGGNATSSFGGASNFSFGFSKPAVHTDDKKSEDTVEQQEEDSTAQFKPVAKLNDEKVEEKTGEEEEETLYTKRSKIQRFDKESKKYEAKGLGDLKVLLNGTTKKARILVRADGSNRVILNVPIVGTFKYEKMGAKGNMVKIPVVEEGKIETYLATVKTGEDGQNLLDSLEKAKETLQ